MRYSPEIIAALDALPMHPVFLCDLNAGVIAVAQRFDARDSIDRYTSAESNETYGFPCAQSSAAIRRMLDAAAEKLGVLVDFSPLYAVLERPCAGFRGFARGPHDGLEALVDLALSSGHVVIDRTPQDDCAIEQLVAAIHLALFGTLPLNVAGQYRGCPLCAEGARNGRSILGETLAGANVSGALRPGFQYPGPHARAGAILDGRESIFLPPEMAALRLGIAAKPLIAGITERQRAALERFHPQMVRDAIALGLMPATDGVDVAASAAGGLA